MSKDIKLNKAAKLELLSGVKQLADAVRVTLGPKGQNVAYFDVYGRPVVTKDGIAVAEQVVLENKFQDLGVSIVRQASKKTATVAGDGTTTSIVLAEAFINKGYDLLENNNAVDITKNLKALEKDVIKELNDLKKECSDLETIKNVARISSNGDEFISDLIVNAIDEVGNEGVVTIDDSVDNTTSLELSEGYQLSRGFLSSYFANDVNKTKAILDNCYIAVIDKNVENALELMKALSLSVEDGRPLLVIAPNISVEVIEALVVNHLKATIKVCAVRGPLSGEQGHEILLDICAATGAQLISDKFERKLSSCEKSWFGSAKKVAVTKDYTTIQQGAGTVEDLQARVENIKQALKSSESEYQTEKFKERIAKLVGKIAVIRVGAATDVERIELKARVEDAIQATKAAIQEGIVPGGGAALVYIHNKLKSNYGGFKDVLLSSCSQVLSNASLNVQNVLASLDRQPWTCYNVNTNNYGDALELGVIDPVIVTKQAITNAISVASMILTTDAVIVEKELPNGNTGHSGQI